MLPRDLGIGLLFEHIRDAVIVADAQTGRIVLWNPAATAIFGYSADEARQLPLEALVPERLRARHRAGLRRYGETGHGALIDSNAALEFPAVHRDGHEIQVELNLSPLPHPAGGRLALAIVRDATERKRLEEALRASAESFESLFHATAEGVAIHDGRRHLAVNETLAAMLGYEVAELIGRSPLDVVTPESRAVLREKMRRRDERPYEVDGLRKDGSTFPAEIAGKAIRYQGRPARLVTVRDITERRRLQEAALRASEARFLTVFAASPVAMSISALADGRFREVNESFLRLTGYRREEVIGRTAGDLALSPVPDRRAALVRAAREPGGARDLEGAYRTKSGEARAALVSAEIVTVDGEECLLSFLTDITERKQAEEVRAGLLERERAARAQAEQAARLRDEFLSVASHELKTPLATVKINAEILARQLAAPALERDRLAQVVARLQGQVARLELLVADLLDLSQLRQGGPALRAEPTDLAALARRVLDRFAADVERRGRCTLTLDAAGPVVGRWDPDRLDQVLTNLVSNALKYSPEGGEVRVGVRRDDGEAELTVSDQGIGIPPAERATLFEPFARGAAARRIAEGTGLGLSIAATIVARHGGTIACESEVGVGSTFTVRLPLTPPDQ